MGMCDGPADDLYLGEEFCRNAGQNIHSRSSVYRLPPENSESGFYHRRWDIIRVHNVIIKLLHTGRLDVSGLITHRFPFEEAPQAYRLIDEGAAGMLKVVFDLTSEQNSPSHSATCIHLGCTFPYMEGLACRAK